MKNRFSAINIKPIELLFITIICSCTIYFIFSTISQVNFKSDILKKYEKNYPLDRGIFTSFSEVVDNERLIIKEDLDLKLERNIYSFFSSQKDIIDKIYFNNLKIYPMDVMNIKKESSKDLKLNGDNEILKFFCINKDYYIDYIKDYIDGVGFKDIDFKGDGIRTPILLGSDFKNIYKIGEIIQNEKTKETFEVRGFIKKDKFIFSMTGSPAYGMESLNNSIVSTYNEEGLERAMKKNLSMKNEKDIMDEDAVLIYDLTKIIPSIILKVSPEYELDQAMKELDKRLINNGLSVELLSMKSDIDTFIERFNHEISFNTLILSVFGILSIMVVSTIINYTIQKFKYNIGILYSIGATTKDILNIFFSKIIQISVIALVFGGILYVNIRKSVYLFFVNEIRIEYIIYGSILYMSIISVSFIAPIIKMRKYEPMDLLKGGRE
ncbi:ABC transporter permease [Clostridium sp. AL.422]|uniref:ABC transporter permease n=1 Tax=Clostridium TaxID=1485 RepID=UPI00293E0067|nr:MULTISPECIES: ABC transporter permease [unclassified Clostridium]MDV4150207.1 ABC transporter permease [Clostridium sp. AL.422]